LGKTKTKMNRFLGVKIIPKFAVDAIVRPVVLLMLHLRDHVVPHAKNHYHPHLLRSRALALFAIFLICVKLFTVSAMAFSPAEDANSLQITSQNILSLTNLSRKTFGLNQLSLNEQLTKAAQAKANDMSLKKYFAHTSPEGLTPWNFIENSGYKYLVAGENLAINFISAGSMEEAWMNSPGHKANILNKNFEESGIGISYGKYGDKQAVFVVQMFGMSAEQKIQLASAPTIVETNSVPEPSLENSLQEQAVKISDIKTEVVGEKILLTVKASETAVKVLAKYGNRAVMLSPTADGLWQGEVLLSSLAVGEGENLQILALDIHNKTAEENVGYFSGNANENFNLQLSSLPQQTKVLGAFVDVRKTEHKIYLILATIILSCLTISLAIARRKTNFHSIVSAPLLVIFCLLLL
jgi:hypothetical protein